MEKIVKIENEKKIGESLMEIKRVAVKAVTFKDGKILLIRTNKDDYKFPGGGLKEGESFIDALKREMLEETGYKVSDVMEIVISVVEKKPDLYEERAAFVMESQYWTCNIEPNKQYEQSLDEYEAELDFKVEFVLLKEAYTKNSDLLKGDDENLNPWVSRESEVMKKLMEMGY
ncbi:MAG: NUDIX domain-containing protein [Alkaliphilus sp.]